MHTTHIIKENIYELFMNQKNRYFKINMVIKRVLIYIIYDIYIYHI